MTVKKGNVLIVLGVMNVAAFILTWFSGVYFFIFLVTAIALAFILDEKAMEDKQIDSQLKRVKERQTDVEVQLVKLQEEVKRTQTQVNMSGMIRK